jgi:hypothetical protein
MEEPVIGWLIPYYGHITSRLTHPVLLLIHTPLVQYCSEYGTT